jgi:hypothetical protein
VGIDRPDDDDAPTVDRDLRQVGGDSPALERERPGEHGSPSEQDSGTDLEAKQAAYNVEFRAKVGAAYRAAWDEAVPALQDARSEHEARYPLPERSRPTQGEDGSWHAEGGLDLDPGQNAEATKKCAEIREQAKDDILPAMRRVEAADSERQLAGLEHWLKGEDRLKEKIAAYLRAPGVTVTQAFEMVPDAVRFTFVHSYERYSEGVRADVERLKAEGFEQIKLKKLWTGDQYKGINTQWSNPETGLRFEVQFHTPESLEAKEHTHWAYERLRLRDSRITPAERADLETYQRRVNTLIATPPGIDAIDEAQENER